MNQEDYFKNMGKPEHLKTISDLDGKPLFEICIYPNIKSVSIQSLKHDLVYHLAWADWISISDYLLGRLQKEKPKEEVKAKSDLGHRMLDGSKHCGQC